MEPVNILDALVDTENWLNWTRPFGPLSGLDAKVSDPALRYVLTTFCYGSNLGPTQTARSVPGAMATHRPNQPRSLGFRTYLALTSCHAFVIGKN